MARARQAVVAAHYAMGLPMLAEPALAAEVVAPVRRFDKSDDSAWRKRLAAE